jgi:acetyl-CoA transporter-like protein
MAFLYASPLSALQYQCTGVRALPSRLQAVWGPLVDSYSIPRLGRRKSWILPVQLGLAAVLCVGGLLGGTPRTGPVSSPALYRVYPDRLETCCLPFSLTGFVESPSRLFPALLAANLLSSVQDVAVDALAIEVRRCVGGRSSTVDSGATLCCGLVFALLWPCLLQTLRGAELGAGNAAQVVGFKVCCLPPSRTLYCV